ncbi:MAG: MGMT family protein [Gammaproteobacteria bacterium]|nr:MGMT family protein [Gammaproteobacteria bacterium]
MPKSEVTWEKIWEAVRQIPRGKVMTYGQVATKVGLNDQTDGPNVGRAMRRARENNDGTPWWRVLQAVSGTNGRYAQISPDPSSERPKEQRELLKEEGIEFESERVDLHKYGGGSIKSRPRPRKI